MIEFSDFAVLALQLAVIIFIVEAVTETIKYVFKDRKKLNATAEFYIALVIGIGSALVLQISLFDTTNLVFFYAGSVLAGAIASRGANHMHDILKTLGALPKK